MTDALRHREDILSAVQFQTDRQPDFATVAELLARRYSCRAFEPTPVSDADIEAMFSVAQMSASWCNSQPWGVHVIQGEAVNRFSAGLLDYAAAHPGVRQTDFPFPEAYRGVYDERRRTCGWQLYEAAGIARGDREASRDQTLANFRFFGAPQVAIITTETDLGVYGAIDCGIFIGNVLMAAQSLGVATIAQASLAMMAPYVREFLGLPEGRSIVCGLSFGYASDRPVNGFRTGRAAFNDAVTWVKD